MCKREPQHAAYIEIEPAGIKFGESPHASCIVHNLPLIPGIAQQVGNVIRALADDTLRIDRQPTACFTVQDIVVMEITVQRNDVALGVEQPAGNGRAAPQQVRSSFGLEERGEPVS